MNDKHICPICGSKQKYIGNTYLCVTCDYVQIMDIEWCERWKKMTELRNHI